MKNSRQPLSSSHEPVERQDTLYAALTGRMAWAALTAMAACLAALMLVKSSPSTHAQSPDERALSAAKAALFIPLLPHETTWLGNSFGDGAKHHLQMQIDVAGLYVAGNGTCYTNCLSSDQSRVAGLYQDGHALVNVPDMGGFGRFGGSAVAVDDKYLYLGAQQENSGPIAANANGEAKYPPRSVTWFGIKRYTRDGLADAPWPEGLGFDGNLLVVNTSVTPNANIWGLACDDDHHLYASDRLHNRILVYDTRTLRRVSSFAAFQPRNLVWDAVHNRLWVISKMHDEGEIARDSADPGDLAGVAAAQPLGNQEPPSRVVCYDQSGHEDKQRAIDGIADPTAICVDPRGRLYVADNGPNQDVNIYRVSDAATTLAGTFGAKGGIFSGQPEEIGRFGNERFNGLTGVGCDAAGNIYVSGNGNGPDLNENNRYRNFGSGTVLESYNLETRRLNWRLMSLPFVSCAQVDPENDTAVFSSEQRYSLDYSQTAPGTEWSYFGTLVDRFKYPEDYRLRTSNTQKALYSLVRVHGRLLMTAGADQYYNIYRFSRETDGVIAIPSVTFGGPAKARIWTDSNGDGRHQADEYADYDSYINAMRGAQMDSNGDIWSRDDKRGIVHWPFEGFDAHDNPRYSWNTFESIPSPAPFSRIMRVDYDAANDKMYLCGFRDGEAYDKQRTLGTTLAVYDHWSQGNRTAAWTTRFLDVARDTESTSITPVALAFAGNYVFLEYKQTTGVRVYDANNGSYVGGLIPDPDVTGDMSPIWVDYQRGMQAHERANGEYDIFTEDDIFDKILLYRWTPDAREASKARRSAMQVADRGGINK